MRIISKFRDYYDGVQAYGQSDVLYLRGKEEEYVGEKSLPFNLHSNFPGFHQGLGYLEEFIFGVAGKIYSGWRIRFRGFSTDLDKVSVGKSPTFFSFEEFDNYLKDTCPKFYKKYEEKNGHDSERTVLYPLHKNRAKEWFKKDILFPNVDYPVFLSIKGYASCPIFIKNANLSKYEFAKVLPPYQCYQEIEMWLNNRAAPNKPIPAVSNEDLIEAKGFDLKTSFRKEKVK